METNTQKGWEDLANEKLGNLSYIWLRIGHELTPELKDFIKQVERVTEERTVREILEIIPESLWSTSKIKQYAASKGITLSPP